MWASIADFLMSAAFLAVVGGFLSAMAGAVAGQHPTVASFLSAVAAWFSSRKTPPAAMLAVVALVLSSGFARASELPVIITTTDGKQYMKASDGHYYSSAHVRADGSVSPVPIVKGMGCICGDNCSCKAGTCPSKCPVQAGSKSCNCVPHIPGTPWPNSGNCGAYTCPMNGGRGNCPCVNPATAQPMYYAVPSCSSGGCALPSYPQFYSAPSSPCPSCPNGNCPAPQSRGFFFRR